jgi:1,4-alpha-glucan branching enzyme
MPPMTLLTEDDLHWFNEGTHLHLYHKLGSRPWTHEGVEGV